MRKRWILSQFFEKNILLTEMKSSQSSLLGTFQTKILWFQICGFGSGASSENVELIGDTGTWYMLHGAVFLQSILLHLPAPAPQGRKVPSVLQDGVIPGRVRRKSAQYTPNRPELAEV